MNLAFSPSSHPVTQRERILLVDDEPQVLVALEDALGDTFDVNATDEPERALQLLENDADIAVVVSDQRMPRMTGDELFRRIRDRSAATRVLATGYADLQAVVRAVNDGNIFAYITKPWDSFDLLSKLQHAAERFRLARELQEERQLLDELMTSVPDGIFFKDKDLRFRRVNDGLLRLMGGLNARDVIGKRIGELGSVSSATSRQIEASEGETLADGRARRDLLHQHEINGGTAWVSTSHAAVKSVPGEIVGLVGIARDVTERVATLEALRTSEERLRLAFNASNTQLFDWNLLVASVPPTEAADAAGDLEGFIQRVHAEDAAVLRSAVHMHLNTRHAFPTLELRVESGDGDPRWLELNAQATWNADGTATRLVGSLLDITARKEHAEQSARLDFLTHYDELTGLPNRTLLTTLIERQLAAKSSRLALVVIDVGRLRLVNETLGRHGGDVLIAAISERIAKTLRPNHTLARFDGAAFAVVVSAPEQEADVAQWLERAVMPCLGEVFAVGDTELRMSFKAGIALFPNDGLTADVLLSHAEAALKNAKRGANAYLFYAATMNSKVADRLSLEGRLRRAISNQEFVLHYQPKVEIRTGKILALEALLRWKDPQRGLIPPGEFIPVLEETAMILDVGRWVLEEAARQFIEWSASTPLAPRIAVNVSALQLARADFVETLDEILRAFPGAERGLDLELTESVVMDDVEGNIAKLQAAKARGLEVAIDDFGTGYSSFGYLSRLPLDALKIDRSFIDRMAHDPQQMSIATTIISLAHSLQLKVIAEGVETATQAHLLRHLRCDEIQGYLVSKPVPPGDVVKYFTTPFVIPSAQFGGRH